MNEFKVIEVRNRARIEVLKDKKEDYLFRNFNLEIKEGVNNINRRRLWQKLEKK